jgi:gliding motility-associated-like protein
VRDTIHIEEILPVDFDLGADRIICDGESILLDPGLGDDVEYIWQDLSTTKTYTVHTAGDYWLQVKDGCGIRSDTVSVSVDLCDCRLYFPNVITPNGDNLNDLATPRATCEMTYCRLKIFDRYGGLLHETDHPDEGWDGITKSKPVQSGVYVYLLVYAFEDGIQHLKTGDLTVLR